MTALKTLTLRLRGAKTELEDAGLETDNMVESTSTLQKKLLALTGGKVDIMLDANTFKSSTEILREMSAEWENMSDIQRASALELMGGKRQANILSSIITNFDIVESAIKSSSESFGSATKENEVWLDSIQGKIDQFTNAVQTMWSNTLDDSWIKIFVDIGTWLVKLTDQAGLLKVALTGIITLLLSRSNVDVTTIPLLSSLSKVFMDIPDAIKGKFKKQNIVESVLGDPQDIQLTVEEFSKELKDSFIKYNDIDTFDIDSQIMDVEQKLQSAQKRLSDANSRDWDYYKQLGSQAPAFDRDTNILDAEADVNSLRNQLMLLRGERDKIINTSATSIAQSIFNEEDAKKAESGFNSIMSVLDQIKGKKLEFGDADVVAAKIDGISDAAAKGQVELGKYVGSLEDGDIALKAYVASVKDGQYTVAGYNDFVRAHNTELQALNKTVDVAIIKQKLLGFAMNIGISLLVTNLLSLGAKGISYLSDKLSGVSESFEDLQDEFEKTNSELSNCKSELNSLESELETTKDKIDELQSSGNLTFVEQEELKKLKETSAELERQIDLKSQLKTNLQKGTNAASINATNRYLNTTSFSAEDTKTERSEKNKETGKTIGTIIGTIAGGIIGGIIAGPMGALAGAGIGGSAVSAIGGAIGSGFGAASYNKEQTVKEALDNMATSRKELIKARDEAYQAYIKNPMDEDIAEEYENAEEALNKYDSKMAEHINQIQSNYSAMDWETATEQQKQDMIEMADILDKYNIEMGGTDAKANAIERIFGQEADENLKKVKQALEDAKTEADKVDIAAIFGDDIASYDKFIDRLYELGLTLVDVKYYFDDVAEAAENAAYEIDSFDAVQSLKTVSEQINSLSSAFSEYRENGIVAADTIVDLNDTFKDVDGWTEFVNAASAGSASLEEFQKIAEKVAKNKIDEIFENGNYDPDDLFTYVAQLRSIGVSNALEYVNDKNEEAAYRAIADSAILTFDEDKLKEEFYQRNKNKTDKDTANRKFASMSEEEKKALAEEYGMLNGEISKETAQEIADRYGIEIENIDEVISKLEDLSVAQENYNKIVAEQNEYDAWNIDYEKQNGYVDSYTKRIEDAKKEIASLEAQYGDIGSWRDTYSSAYSDLSEDEYYAVKARYNALNGDVSKAEEELDKAKKALDDLKKEGKEKGYYDAESGEVIDVDFAAKLEVAKDEVDSLEKYIETECTPDIKLKLNLQNLNDDIDEIQSAYSILSDVVKQYNKDKYLSLDNLQALLDLEPEYIACLQMENGQLSINQAALEAMIQAKLAEAKATVVEKAITELNTLAQQAQEEAINDSSSAAENSISNLGAYASALGTVAKDAIVAAGAVSEFNAAVAGAEAAGVAQEDIDDILTSMENQLAMIDSVSVNLSSAFDKIISPDSSSDDDDDEDLLDSIKKKYENKIAMLEAQKQYLENEISRLEAEGEPVSESLYEEQIELEEKKIDLYEKERAELLAAMDTVPKYSDEWYDMADAVWETEHAIKDSTLAIVEMNDAITQLYLDAFDDIAGAHGNKITFLDDQISYIEEYVSYLETLGISVPDAMYNKLTEIGEKSLKQNYAKLADLEAAEAKAEARIREENGGELNEDDEEWVRLQEEIRQTESDILSAKNQLAEWNKEMREGEWDKFDKFMERIDDLESKINNINNLIDDKDIVNDDGTWTEDGITKLGLLYQQMAINEDQATKYSEQIKELQEQYKNEAISEQDYYDRLKELEDAQWDSINAYEESKDAIIDLHEARIDAIKEGIEKEIDAYNELIDVKKKELEAERDLHDFKKDIEEQSKDIATLQRRIASMSGSTDAATIAERTKLEAELRAAQDALNESYYDHSIDSQSDALDDESEAFEKSKNDYIEKLEKTLEDTETLITNTMYTVLGNADIVLENLNTIADERGVILSEELLQPWEDASVKAEEFKNYATAEVSSLINEDGIITTFNTTAKMLFEKAFGSGETAANKFKTQVSNSINIIKTKLETENPNITKYLKDPWNDGVNAANTFSTETGKVLDKLVTNAKSAANQISSYADGIIQDMRNAQAAIDATGGSGNSGNGGNGSGNSNNDSDTGYTIHNTQLSKSDVLNLQKLLNALFSGNLTLDGIFGTSTMSALKSAQQKLKNLGYDTPTNGLYNAKTRTAMRNYIQDQINKMRKDNNGSSMIGQAIQRYNTYLSWVPDAYAKGTTNKKDDGWAITDEPQFGDELVMYATPQGTLSYMRAGSTVVPADLTKELMKIGELGISGLQNMGGAIQGINLMSNVINKPEIKLDIENFLHVDNVTQDSLGELKKFAKEQINVMFRQLNYGLK